MLYDLDVIRLARQIKNNKFVEEHIHKYYHYMCVLNGNGEVEINGTRYNATEKCFFMIPPGTKHAVYGYKDYCSIDIKFCCDQALMEALGLAKMENPVIRNLGSYESSLVTDMFHEAILATPHFKTLLNAKLLELLVLLGREIAHPGDHETRDCHLLNEPNLTRSSRHIKPVLDYIDANILTPLSVSELAEMCGYATTYFSSIFKDTVGMSPIKYINNRKMEIAKTLMISSNMSITQISDYLGYSSIHYFSKAFKNVLGVSPRVYSDRVNSDVGITLVDNLINTLEDGFEFPAEPLTVRSSK